MPLATSDAFEQRVEAAVRASVQAMLGPEGRQVRVRLARRVVLDGVDANATLAVAPLAGRLPRPQLPVTVRVQSRGQPERLVTAWVELTERRVAPVYAQAQVAGTPVGPAGLELRDVDLACCAGLPLATAQPPQGAVLARAVRAGEPAMAGDFRPAPAVARGDAVTVDAGHGVVRLSIDGQALEAGNPGDRISVRTTVSAHPLQARVIARGKVTLDD
ncbi:flagellar basal body P-ring formation chaperone FlgA [Lysobacter korlensis]|uniref:Flagella basal body P-ring formation protein FlgA n=1 Tax=Lysobacter korlensis TaxID=553636 RepID=A0ABV6RPY1_9GAMM